MRTPRDTESTRTRPDSRLDARDRKPNTVRSGFAETGVPPVISAACDSSIPPESLKDCAAPDRSDATAPTASLPASASKSAASGWGALADWATAPAALTAATCPVAGSAGRIGGTHGQNKRDEDAEGRRGDSNRNGAPDPNWPQLPGFEIRGQCGRGGMGDVYRAFDQKLCVEVALKVPRALSAAARARFLREAQRLAQVEHRNVVGIRSWGDAGEHAYFTMHLISGPNAAMLVDTFRAHHAQRLSGEEILRLAQVDRVGISRDLRRIARDPKPYYRIIALWMAEAAEGLAATHRQDIIHRDVKPGNFLLNPDGRMMVADFGLAMTGEEIAQLGTHEVAGTLPYVPPERAVGDWIRIGARADIWALGATLYEFLAYRRAYERSGREVLVDIATKDPTPSRHVVSEVPARLDDICRRAMARNPDERHSSASELAQVLREWAEVPRRSRISAWSIPALSVCLVAAPLAASERGRVWLASIVDAAQEHAGEAHVKPAPVSLDIQPASLDISLEAGAIDLQQALRIQTVSTNGARRLLSLSECDFEPPAGMAQVKSSRLIPIRAGSGALIVRSGAVQSVVALTIQESVTPAAPTDASQSPAIEMPEPRTTASVQVDAPARAIAVLAVSEDRNTRDDELPRNGGVVERYLDSALRQAGIEMRGVGRPEQAWTEAGALRAARDAGANVLLLARVRATPGALTQVSFQRDLIRDWSVELEVEMIRLDAVDRRRIQSSRDYQWTEIDAEYPGGDEPLKSAAAEALRGDNGMLGVLRGWFQVAEDGVTP